MIGGMRSSLAPLPSGPARELPSAVSLSRNGVDIGLGKQDSSDL